MRQIPAVLMIVLALRSIQWTLADWLIWVRFVRSEVGEVISRSVALESTCLRSVLTMLISGLKARGQSFQLQKDFTNSMFLPVTWQSFGSEMHFK